MSNIYDLFGSKSRDIFKFFHKNGLPKYCYGADGDYFIYDFNCKKVLALLDYKQFVSEKITDTEAGVYDFLESLGIPVFIVIGLLNIADKKDKSCMTEQCSNLKVYKYEISGGKYFISNNFLEWELNFRREARVRFLPLDKY